MTTPLSGRPSAMLPGNVRLRNRPTRMGNAVLGSWIRTAAVAAALIAAFAVVAALVMTGRLGDLRYSNIPLVHPYPPAGYYQNPFNPGDRGDLVKAAEASTVKTDLLRDGQLELAALSSGDDSLASEADTGNALTTLRQLISQNNAAGITERQETHITSITVGRLADPNDASGSIRWSAEERGTVTITRVSKANGQILSQQSAQVTARFWLTKVGGRYLIADAQITATPI